MEKQEKQNSQEYEDFIKGLNDIKENKVKPIEESNIFEY